MQNITALSTVGVGVAFTALAAGWSQVKNIGARLMGLAIVTVETRQRASDAVNAFCWLKLKRTPSPFRYYMGLIRYIRPLGRYGSVAYETIGGKGQLFWYGRRPIWISLADGDASRATFRYLRGTFDADALIMEMMNLQVSLLEVDPNQEVRDRFRVFRMAGKSGKDLLSFRSEKGSKPSAGTEDEPPQLSGGSGSIRTEGDYDARLIGWKREEIGELVPAKNPLARLSLNAETEEAIAEVRRWFTSKDWYTERQIPWRRGLLFYGRPGTGKSSLTKALAQELRIPIYLFDISTMDNQEFHKAWQTALSNTPAIALIEDIDAVFHGRENVVAEKGQGLSYDCLLNTISGVESADGLLLIVTTNNLEHVDPALGIPSPGSTSSRPGRIDRAVELPVLDHAGRIKLATRILTGCDRSWVTYLAQLSVNDTGAQFEDRCATAALNLFWSDDPQRPAPEHDLPKMAIEVVYEGRWAQELDDHTLTVSLEA